MTIRYPLRLLTLGLFMGWAFDLLFWGKMPGVSVFIYSVLLLAGLFLALHWQQTRAMTVNLWMPVLMLVFALLAFMRANGFLIFLDILAIFMLLVLISNNLVRKPAGWLRVSDLFSDVVKSAVYSLAGASHIVSESRRVTSKDLGGRAASYLPAVLVGLLISLPILLVLIPLLMSADMIFADLVKDIFAWDKALEWSFRIAFMVIIGLLVGGVLLYSSQKYPPNSDLFSISPRQTSSSSLRYLGPIETLIPVNLINLLFLAFVVIQIPYLFGGELNISAHSFTYAEYARRGFAELVFVALFIFGIILILSRLSHLESHGAKRAFNLSTSLLLLLTLVLLISAFKRLALYESVYGFTTMRIYPHVFMVWLGILLIWFAATLWIAPGRLAIGILTAAFGFILTLNLLNPDAFIVQKNIERFQEQGQLSVYYENGRVDVDYFSQLSADSVPALLAVLPHLRGSLHDVVAESLNSRYQLMSHTESLQPWQSWNLSRWRAYNLLKDVHFELEN
jgi:hypothetical protein